MRSTPETQRVPQSHSPKLDGTGHYWIYWIYWIYWPLLQFLSVSTHLNTSPRCNPDLGGTGPRRPRLSAFRVTLSWLHLKLQRPPEVIGAQENVSMGEHPNFHQVFPCFSWCIMVSNPTAVSLSSTRELVTSQKAPQDLHAAVESLLVVPQIVLLESKWRRTSHETQDYRTIGYRSQMDLAHLMFRTQAMQLWGS